jgi:hypothetical protein
MKRNHGKTFSFGNILPDNWYLENYSLLAAHMMFYLCNSHENEDEDDK